MQCRFNINVNHNYNIDGGEKYFTINSSCKVYGFQADIITKSPFNFILNRPVELENLESNKSNTHDRTISNYADIVYFNISKILIFSMEGKIINDIRFYYRGDLLMKNIVVAGRNSSGRLIEFTEGIYDNKRIYNKKPKMNMFTKNTGKEVNV